MLSFYTMTKPLKKPSETKVADDGPTYQQSSSETPNTSRLGAILYLLIAAAMVLIFLGALIRYPNQIADLGLVGSLYYWILLLIPILPAFVLFKCLDSFGELKGRNWKFGGAAALYVFLVLQGLKYAPEVTSFSTTIYLYGPGGKQDLILRGMGQVLVDIGGDRRKKNIDADGEVVISEIPSNFLNKTVTISLDANGFELADLVPTVQLVKGSTYIGVRRKSGLIRGYVEDDDGRRLKGINLAVAGMTQLSDDSGNFEFVIPGDKMGSELTLRTEPSGFAALSIHVVPNSVDVPVTLHRQR